jgi:hypothetical protein
VDTVPGKKESSPPAGRAAFPDEWRLVQYCDPPTKAVLVLQKVQLISGLGPNKVLILMDSEIGYYEYCFEATCTLPYA